jgi:TRAP-type C4-dicarboxylate transport system permease large subunit
MISDKPLTFYLVVMLLTFIIGQGMDETSTCRALLVQHC